MALKSLNLARIAQRRLKRKDPARSAASPTWPRDANQMARSCNLAGLVVITLLVGSLVGQAVTGDCIGAWLADRAIARLAAQYAPFAFGLLLGHAPGAVAAFAALAAHLAERVDSGKLADAHRRTTAAWIRDEPFFLGLAATLGLAMAAYGTSALVGTVRVQAHWSHSTSRHAEAAAACAPEPLRDPAVH